MTFFSIYMHPREIDPAIQLNRRVYRKSPVVGPGRSMVSPDACISRSSATTPTCSGWWGAPVATSVPVPTGAPMRCTEACTFVCRRTPWVYAGSPCAQHCARDGGTPIGSEVFVELRYAHGEGAAGNRGDATLSTYQPDGTRIGQPQEENDAEYNLYRDANTISRAYLPNAWPAPSAVYELLRFGRVIGPDALNPATVPHWRRISHPGGVGWVNLNGTNVTQFSDAEDFTGWAGAWWTTAPIRTAAATRPRSRAGWM